MSANHSYRHTGALLVAATLLIGIAWILVLPPFEGFDETAHYSSIREIADTRTLPTYGKSRIATVVEAYGAQAPLPYMQQHGVPLERPMSYRDFLHDDAARAAFVTSFGAAPDAPRRYEPGTSLNWQAQHPPLYYVLLAPLMLASDGVSLVTQMMVLRVASWLMAVAGLLVGVWATALHVRECTPDGSCRALPAVCLAYPFLVPMFFPEFARIGNDSLCLLIFGACWALMLQMLGRRTSLWRAAALGACLGAGLLTKAFFMPISLGVLGCLAWTAWRRSGPDTQRRSALRGVAVTAAIALAVGGWWYIVAYAGHGSVTGSHDVIALDRDGGLLAGLRSHFAWPHLGRGVAGFIVTWYFGGTWTLARLPTWMYLPGLVALAALCTLACRWWRTAATRPLATAALWVIAPLLGALACYMIVRIAGGSEGHGAPGWYMNILAPACAVPLALGMMALGRRRLGAWTSGAMWLWMVAFVVVAWWMHAALYAGVAVKDMATRQLTCPEGWSAMLDVALIRTSLTAFGWPTAAMACLAVGTLLALVAGWRLWRFSANPTDNSRASR